MKRALLIATIASGAVFLVASRAPSPHAAISPPRTRVGANAAWTPSPSVLSDIRQVCSVGDPDQQKACFLDSMKSAGASDEAAAFVKSFAANGLAYIRAFRDTGRVDIAYIEYLFRANDLDGVLLVNGTPPIIDVDDYAFISNEDLRKNGDYGVLLQKYPNIGVFPDDRYHTNAPDEITSTGKNQIFTVEYLLQECHACARVGTLVASFTFDADGRFVGVSALKVRPGGDADYDRPMLSRRPEPGSSTEPTIDPTEVHASVGKSFTIVLPANHTTGYSWRLAKPMDPKLLKRLNETYSEDTTRMGAGGKEFWTFEPESKGTTDIEFEYARPFEKDAASVDRAKYRINIK